MGWVEAGGAGGPGLKTVSSDSKEGVADGPSLNSLRSRCHDGCPGSLQLGPGIARTSIEVFPICTRPPQPTATIGSPPKADRRPKVAVAPIPISPASPPTTGYVFRILNTIGSDRVRSVCSVCEVGAAAWREKRKCRIRMMRWH
jgi:hypothetical protein